MELDPITDSKLTIKLFKHVTNTRQLKESLKNGQLKCCIIKPELIFDPFQIIVAVNKAVLAKKLTTKTIYTEILFNLSITKNILKSLQTFGIDEKDVTVLVVTLDEDRNIYQQIEGVEIPLDDLKKYTDINLIKKTYKISENESRAG
ncbi:EKC/KEOPS complex subunit Tprkb-like [Diorhabda carinulata]|uniref:EKC/KEOPS complex subunit Tprkb-like n=1 Tax=Diorhabda carinulata TaxID=1163345 RepID=UPI0025A2B211|nr:EKC/KEOPS complex subunit Tprkb-like [Diorhabda carinulata]